MYRIVDEYWMGRALKLAALGKHASPNPMVGCVIVDADGIKRGEGFHPEPGTPHAEIFALRQAGSASKGATAYVTLEPCSHHGRTPPCADALIAAGIARVVTAMSDPDPRVSGSGVLRLEAAGIPVETGVLESRARSLNRAYVYHRTTGLPWVTVKVASTLDGKIATASGDSRWITGSFTRKWVHRQLRDRTDAIIVGVSTVQIDDPELTTRLSNGKGRDAFRVIADSKLRTPLESKIVKQSASDGKTIIACLARFAQIRGLTYEERGVRIVPVEADRFDRVDLSGLMTYLGTSMHFSSVLVEGGAEVIASVVRLGLVNRYIATVAPKLIGGSSAPGAIGGEGFASTMRDAIPLSRWIVRRSAGDLVIDALLSEN